MTEPLPLLDPAVVAAFAELGGDDGDNPTAAILAMFRRETETRMIRLRAAVERGDLDAIAREAHAIRGGAGVVGAVRLTAVAQVLERLAAARAAAMDIAEAWQEVSAASTATLAALG